MRCAPGQSRSAAGSQKGRFISGGARELSPDLGVNDKHSAQLRANGHPSGLEEFGVVNGE